MCRARISATAARKSFETYPELSVIAFMMSVIGLSLPEIVILREVLRPPLIAAFVGVVASGILIVGFVFNAVL